MRFVAPIVCPAAVVLLAAAPCQADEFCAAIRTVAAAAPSHFNGLLARDEASPTYYLPSTSSYLLPGAQGKNTGMESTSHSPCEINQFPRYDSEGSILGDSGSYYYACYFDHGNGHDDGVALAAILAAQVGDCLKRPVPTPIVEDSDNIRYSVTYTTRVDGVDYTVSRQRLWVELDIGEPPPGSK